MPPNTTSQRKSAASQTEPIVETLPPEAWPGIEDLITEDDTPVDNIFSEKQQRLLTESLYSSWAERTFVALANVGLFYTFRKPPLVPDVLLSLDVQVPADLWTQPHRSYFVSQYGKPPEVVIEVVSNREGGEANAKRHDYAGIGVRYYVIFDPEQLLSERVLRLYERDRGTYVEMTISWLAAVGLGLRLWEGTFEGVHATWLRWYDRDNQVLPTGAERAGQAEQRAEQERQHAEQERQRAEQERQRAEQEAQRAETEAAARRAAEQQATQEAQRAKAAENELARLRAALKEKGIDL